VTGPIPTEPRFVDTDAGLAELVRELIDEPRYGLDTEFHGERTYWPKLALVQVSWSGGIALIDPLAVDPAPLGAVFEGPGTMVAHASGQDLSILQRATGTSPSKLFDTQIAAGFVGYGVPSLLFLVEQLLSVRLVKGDQLADWTRRPLQEAQREYAASDVAYLFALEDALVAKLEEKGRLVWAIDECETMRTRNRSRPEPDTAWWKLKGARGLRGKARGVAQEVAAWRERTAQEQDRPVRFVLPDLAVLGIAHRPPTTADEVRAVRGLDERHLRGNARAEVLAAVNRGLALDKDELRLPTDDGGERIPQPTVALVTAWVNQLANDLGLDPALLATRSDLQSLLRGEEGSRLMHGWRNEIIAEPVRRLVSGEAAIALTRNGERLSLEDRYRPDPG
jgi:ribonuclease D